MYSILTIIVAAPGHTPPHAFDSACLFLPQVVVYMSVEGCLGCAFGTGPAVARYLPHGNGGTVPGSCPGDNDHPGRAIKGQKVRRMTCSAPNPVPVGAHAEPCCLSSRLQEPRDGHPRRQPAGPRREFARRAHCRLRPPAPIAALVALAASSTCCMLRSWLAYCRVATPPPASLPPPTPAQSSS